MLQATNYSFCRLICTATAAAFCVQVQNPAFVSLMWMKMANWILYSVLQGYLTPALMTFFTTMPVSSHFMSSVDSEVSMIELCMPVAVSVHIFHISKPFYSMWHLNARFLQRAAMLALQALY